MKEQVIINLVENHLNYKNRYFINVHGSSFSKNGTPDIITSDKNNIFLGIECKVDGKKLFVNQIRNGFEILKSGGRFIVAVSDFDIDLVDNKKIPTIKLNAYTDEFDPKLYDIKYKKTTEFILERSKN